MTQAELVQELLQGVPLLVLEYRGSHAEEAGYVDRKYGNKITYIRGIHIGEGKWHGHVAPIIVTERFREEINTVELAQATFRYVKGRRYVFYIDWLKQERGQAFAALSGWGIEEIEEDKKALATPEAWLRP